MLPLQVIEECKWQKKTLWFQFCQCVKNDKLLGQANYSQQSNEKYEESHRDATKQADPFTFILVTQEKKEDRLEISIVEQLKTESNGQSLEVAEKFFNLGDKTRD